ncbi:MAG: hypothetical protein GX594_16295 [Pirellulaceae bacterium]|nr:hypothetical protein [Pirellulaceae bacterium]
MFQPLDAEAEKPSEDKQPQAVAREVKNDQNSTNALILEALIALLAVARHNINSHK